MTVLVGEVVGSNLAVLPPDVETKVNELRPLDGAAQAAQVTAMLSHARTGLLVAIAAQDLPQIVEFKRKAAAIQEIAKQVRMGKEFQLDAAEFVRRAERGLGVAIRTGQQEGSVETKSDASRRGTAVREINQGRRHSSDEDLLRGKLRPTDLAPVSELQGARGDGIYAMTDGIPDAAFEEALAEARAEAEAGSNNGAYAMGRANVVRKCKAKVGNNQSLKDSSSAETGLAETKEAGQPKKRLTKHDSAEMLANINGMLNGIVESLPFIDPAEVAISDPMNRRVIHNIRESMSHIRKLLKEIENG